MKDFPGFLAGYIREKRVVGKVEFTAMGFDFNAVKDILACPKCKSSLIQQADSLICTNAECRLQFAIEDDIPVMLVEEAKELSQEQWAQLVQGSQETSNADS